MAPWVPHLRRVRGYTFRKKGRRGRYSALLVHPSFVGQRAGDVRTVIA